MKEYVITVWDGNHKYSYKMSTNNIDRYVADLKKINNRVLVQEA